MDKSGKELLANFRFDCRIFGHHAKTNSFLGNRNSE